MKDCCVCGNCSWQGPLAAAKELAHVPELAQRLTPGDEVPAGECPKCGALAYLANASAPVICIEVRGGLVQDVLWAKSASQGQRWARRRIAKDPLDVDDDFLIYHKSQASAPLMKRAWSAAS